MVVVKRKKATRWLFFIAIAWLLVISTRFIPDFLAARLENKYKPFIEADFRDAKTPVNVIVLGAGHSDDKRLSANAQLSTAALGRLVEGIRIYRMVTGNRRPATGRTNGLKGEEAQRLNGEGEYKPATGNRQPATGRTNGLKGEDRIDSGTKGRRDEGKKDEGTEGRGDEGTNKGRNCAECHNRLIVSGYAGRLKISQAEVLYKTALMLGVDSTDLIMSPKPKNTREEAEEYIKKFGKGNSLVVVTDAIHMPRAVMLFEKAGVKVIPAPTNFLVKQSTAKNPFSWMPGAGNISVMEAVVHEYAGLVWARLGGD